MKPKLCPKCRKAELEYRRKLRLKKKKSGKCIHCNNKAEKGKTRCRECLDYANEWKANRKTKKK